MTPSTPALGIYPHQASSNSVNGAIIVRQLNFAAREHEHPEAQVSILFQGGSGTFVTHNAIGRTVRTPVVPEGVVYIAPGQPHRTHWNGYGELLNLYFTETLLQELAEEGGCGLADPHPAYRVERGAFEIGRLLMDEFAWTGGLPPTTIDHAAMLIARRLLRVSASLSQHQTSGLLPLKRLQAAIDFIRANPEKPFTLIQLARLCNSSVFHFARSFSAVAGCAPFSFQRNLRLEKACRVLIETDLSVAAVGAAVGVENPAHFSRMFRRQTGYLPRDFRRLKPEQKL